MRFLTIPDDYSSFMATLSYTLTTDSSVPRDVEIEIVSQNGNQVLATTTLRQMTTATIDIAPMLREKITYSPPSEVTAVEIIKAYPHQKIYLRAEGVSSPTRTIIAAQVDSTQPLTPLATQHTIRSIAHDECDMIGLVVTDTANSAIMINYYGKDSGSKILTSSITGQLILVVHPASLGDCDSIEVELRDPSGVLSLIKYDVRRNLKGARRIGWLNRHHAPEIYTFPMRKNILIEATRQHLESIYGRGAGEVERDGELKLISAYEPQSQLHALAEMVHSPQVWLMKGCQRQEVDLMTDRVLLTPAERLGFVEIDIRAAQEGEEL